MKSRLSPDGSAEARGVYQYPTRAGDRGDCSTSSIDQRRLANMTAVAEVPKFSNQLVNTIVSNWRASATVAMASGAHLTVSEGTDQALTGKDTLNQPPNQVLSNSLCPRGHAKQAQHRRGSIPQSGGILAGDTGHAGECGARDRGGPRKPDIQRGFVAAVQAEGALHGGGPSRSAKRIEPGELLEPWPVNQQQHLRLHYRNGTGENHAVCHEVQLLI